VLGLGNQPAHAKNDKEDNDDRGNGNANGHEKNDHADSAPKGESASAPGHNKSSSTPESVSAARFGATGTPDTKRGALNAVHANLEAFIHASPNSKVGQIAAYARASVALETAIAIPGGDQAAVEAANDALAAAQAAYDISVMYLTGAFAGFDDVSDEALEAESAEINSAIATSTDPGLLAILEARLAAVEAVLANSAELAALRLAVAQAEGEVVDAAAIAQAELVAIEALNAAAGGPVDPATKAWLDAQLQASGVLDYFRSLVTTP
jgi:hypothetical protein